MAEEHKPEGKPTPTLEIKKVEMTQEEFDTKFNASFGKGAAKANADLLESLGVENLDDLKVIVKAKTDADEASKTELEKVQGLLNSERDKSIDLESRLNLNIANTEVQDFALDSGIDNSKMRYFKMDYAEAKKSEGFNKDNFIEELKEREPSFFTDNLDKTPANVPNPPNRSNPSTQIKMEDYAQLSAAERKKYKSSDIIR